MLWILKSRNSAGLHLTQRQYIADFLHLTKMTNGKSVSTPVFPTTPLDLDTGTVLDDAKKYMVVVSSLQYISLTTPYICFSVNKL